MIISSGIVTLSSGAQQDQVEDGATLRVVAGGSAYQTFVYGSLMDVSAGGTGNQTELQPDADLTVFNSGYVTATSIDGATLTVSQGGTAEGGSLRGNGTIQVDSGGIATGFDLISGSAFVADGGVIADTTSELGVLIVSAGGRAINVGVNAGRVVSGTMVIEAGATASVTSQNTVYDVTLQGGDMTVFAAGSAWATQVKADAVLTALGVLTGTVVSSGGSVTVSSGGQDISGSILLGGAETVEAGGTALGALIYGGGVITAASSGVVSGGAASGTVNVQAGGSAVGVALQSHGSAVVSAGGTAIGLVVAGGSESVLAGGTDSGTTVSAGTMAVSAGGLAENTTVVAGSALILSGGSESVTPYGSAVGVTLQGGRMSVGSQGVGYETQVQNNGVLAVSDTGLLSATQVSSGGQVLISAGGTDSGNVIETGGTETVLSGGTAVATDLGVFSPAIPGGTLSVGSGGVASDTTFIDGGNLVVGFGGTAIDPINNATSPGITTVSSGGVVSETAGGTILGVKIMGGGSLELAAGATADVVNAAGGTLTIGDGVSLVSGAADDGGLITIASGGTGDVVIAGPGGNVVVASGALLVLGGAAGGTLDIQNGGVIQGGLAFSQYAGDIILGGTSLPNVPVGGLGPDTTIDLPNIAFDPAGSVTSANNVLSFTEHGQTDTIDLVSASIGTHTLSLAQDASGGTLIEVACFAAGTRIATPSGAAPVEALRPGDVVLALEDGAWRPARVRWVGCTMVDLARHPRPQQAAPIRIRAHAFADAVPHRDLFVSPDHAIFVDGVLMQAQSLRNGATVVQEFPPRVTYWHVELDRHAVLCAEGLAAESYLDTGNRALFAGEAGARPLHPDMAAAAWNELACAQLHLAGPLVAAAHARLLLRAVALGWNVAADPALRIVADDREVLAFAGGAGAWHATLPAGTRAVRLLSRRFVPAWFAEDDRRQLGVAVRALRLGGRRLPRTAFGAGWHAQEREWRWTDGAGVLHVAPRARPATLAVTLARAGMRYWCAPAAAKLRCTG
jgi:autotransporter passenger strand-loop-strand repeat protein